MGAFAPSLYEGVGSSKATSGVADLGRLRRLGICPRSLCVPGLGVGTLHCHCMGHMLAGCALHVLDEFRGGIPACNEREQTM